MLYLVKGMAGVYEFTRSYQEMQDAPFMPTLALSMLMGIENSSSGAAIESKVQAAGGWETMDANFNTKLLNRMPEKQPMYEATE